MALTDPQRADLRLRSAEIAVRFGTKVDLERDACLKAAEKIYKFAVGITEQPAPEVDK